MCCLDQDRFGYVKTRRNRSGFPPSIFFGIPTRFQRTIVKNNMSKVLGLFSTQFLNCNFAQNNRHIILMEPTPNLNAGSYEIINYLEL